MLQNAANCTVEKFFSGNTKNLLANARGVRGHKHLVCNTLVLAYATRRKPPPPKKNKKTKKQLAPLANPAYAHELLLRNVFENPPWQTVDCV